jgi:Tfp pilus assembly protein PilV
MINRRKQTTSSPFRLYDGNEAVRSELIDEQLSQGKSASSKPQAVTAWPEQHYTKPTRSFRQQAGMMLMEALIGVLLFSLGIIVTLKLQAEGIRLTSESKERADASFLADKVAGDLATQNLAGGATAISTVITDYQGTYTATTTAGIGAAADANVYGRWQAMLVRTVPMGSLQILIDSAADPINATNMIRVATVVITWTSPSGGAARSFTQSARLVD